MEKLTIKELKKQIKELEELIYGDVVCYGRSDLLLLSALQKELERREGLTK